MVLGPHIWKYGKVYDPEGLLSTLPAISTTLFGVLTGHWLRSQSRHPVEKACGIFFVGALAVALGWAWNFWFPINKALWTSSYAVFTAGLALQLLGICYWLIEIKNYRLWSKPFVIFGANALALYVFSETLGRLMTLEYWSLPLKGGATGNLQSFLYQHLFASWAAPLQASLLYAIAYIFFCLFLMWLLYRKDIFIKV
jgi:predicted acyltransferase